MDTFVRASLECGIVFLAFVVSGFGGFGGGLIMAPLLVFFINLQQAVAVSIFLQLVGEGYLALSKRESIDVKLFFIVVIPSCVCSIVGVYTLIRVNSSLLLVILGIMTIIFSVRMFIQPINPFTSPFKHSSYPIGTVLGGVSGLLQGLFGTGGPPVVLFFTNTINTKAKLRATLILYFFILDIIVVVAFLITSALSKTESSIGPDVLRLMGILLAPTILGSIVGSRLQRHISEISFRRIMAVILILTGVLIIHKGFTF